MEYPQRTRKTYHKVETDEKKEVNFSAELILCRVVKSNEGGRTLHRLNRFV